MTRILNGIAQDVLFIAAKGNSLADHIFKNDSLWKSDFDIGLTLLAFDIVLKLFLFLAHLSFNVVIKCVLSNKMCCIYK